MLDAKPLEPNNHEAILKEINPAVGFNQADMFQCTTGTCGQWLPRSKAHSPNAQNPTICKECFAQKQAEKKARKLAKEQALQSQQGEKTVKVTHTIDLWTQVAIEVLANGKTNSSVIDRAIKELVDRQDDETKAVIQFLYKKRLAALDG
ncbi:hypothetical protein [Effusibacillus pohliae]|uniref:hypothetical protein n=1 Tax=Effusibacillus pohliae TaxID=232270 RepID=UPI000379D72C|nr:hypothetical protein [Effusibacillus pohliae]